MDVAATGHQPSRGVGLALLHLVFTLPRPDMAEGIDQLAGVEHIRAQRSVVIAIARDVHQREVVGSDKDGHAFLLRPVVDVFQFVRERLAHEMAQLAQTARGHSEVEPAVGPPLLHHATLLGHVGIGGKHIAALVRMVGIDALDETVDDALPVGRSPPHDTGVGAGVPPFHPPHETLTVGHLGREGGEGLKLLIDIDEEVDAHLVGPASVGEKPPQQRDGLYRHVAVGRGLPDGLSVIADEPADGFSRGRQRAPAVKTQGLCEPTTEANGIGARHRHLSNVGQPGSEQFTNITRGKFHLLLFHKH